MLIFVVLTLFFADSCTEERLRNLCAQAVSLEQHLQQEVRKAEVTMIHYLTNRRPILMPFLLQLQRSKLPAGRP